MTTDPASPAHDSFAELQRKRTLAHGLGGPERVARQHERGFLTARERVELLIDPGSQFQFGPFLHSGLPGQEDRTLGDGRLMGFGRIDGRPIAYIAGDATVKGATGGAGAKRRAAAFDRIVEAAGIPMFHLIQGGGARITEILGSRFSGFYGPGLGQRCAFPRRHADFLAVLGNYYAPWNAADADFAIMTRNSNISVSSPPVVEEATGQKVTAFELGGPEIHAKVTGQIDAVCEDDAAAIAMLRRVFGYLPANPWVAPPVVRTGDPVDRLAPELRDIVPTDFRRAYDVKKIIERVFDLGSFIELRPEYGRNLVAGMARLDGHTVGIIANQPSQLSGAIDQQAVHKVRRVLNLCESFALPLVSLIDVPGVMPTLREEHNRLLTAIYGLSVDRIRLPTAKISLFLRKAYGLALFSMSGADPEWHAYAWPSAQIAFIGPEPGVRVAYRREWETAADPRQFLRDAAERLRNEAYPWPAAHLAYLDDVIDPAETRQVLARTLAVCRARMEARPYRATTVR